MNGVAVLYTNTGQANFFGLQRRKRRLFFLCVCVCVILCGTEPGNGPFETLLVLCGRRVELSSSWLEVTGDSDFM